MERINIKELDDGSYQIGGTDDISGGSKEEVLEKVNKIILREVINLSLEEL